MFSDARIMDECPVAVLGPKIRKKFGKLSKAVPMYAWGLNRIRHSEMPRLKRKSIVRYGRECVPLCQHREAGAIRLALVASKRWSLKQLRFMGSHNNRSRIYLP